MGTRSGTGQCPVHRGHEAEVSFYILRSSGELGTTPTRDADQIRRSRQPHAGPVSHCQPLAALECAARCPSRP